MQKQKIRDIFLGVLAFIYVTATIFMCYAAYKGGFNDAVKTEKTKILHIEFEESEFMEMEENKFPFLNKELSDYVVRMCAELDLDPYICISILLRENPGFDSKAVHENSNGTFDLGLWQLNSAYVWTTFKDRYWTFDFDLDPMNWKHNTYIALCHIRYLYDTLKNDDDVILAYNCGEFAVMNNNIPGITSVYLAAVKMNYKLIKVEG